MEVKKEEVKGIIFEILAVSFYIALTFLAVLVMG
jgi:hypothetical protein